MSPEDREAIAAQLTALADDEMVLAHRNSEWTGYAPILEEDIAFTNIALDEMGHAALWYGKLAELLAEDPESFPDRMVFFRDAEAYRNVQMVELPNEDWAFSILRQYLYDCAELVRLEALGQSMYAPFSETARKVLPEELYHHRHTKAWVQRLGLGTEESNARAQRALDRLYPYALQLFQPLPMENSLLAQGYVPDPQVLRGQWDSELRSHLVPSGLEFPDAEIPCISSRSEHTEHLTSLLAELQQVARSDAEAAW